jgi:hypothetical protein
LRRGGHRIAKATTKSSSPQRPTAPRANKNIAVSVDPEKRARVERIWEEHNAVSAVPVSKSAIYRVVLEQGILWFEKGLNLKTAVATP